MGIVKYFEQDGQKTFDVIQALNDSGWGITFNNILDTKGLRLVDRADESHKVTISSITLDRFTKTYFVHFREGGWQCLDNAIDQFARAIIPNTNEIQLYLHCQLCLDELPEGLSPNQWQDLAVGWTPIGLQVWCKRHNCNIMHVDFEGAKHPANTSRAKGKGEV